MDRRHAGRPRGRFVVTLALAALPWFWAPAVARDSDDDGLRDGFERRYGLTGPDRRDSDHDGVVDGAEDPDHDRLSNLGEQRFDTDPGASDSDGDGRTDGRDDADRDGRADAREQDRRPVPQGLEPPLATAPGDTPVIYRNGCHTAPPVRAIAPCEFGDEAGGAVVAVFGDSHAAQWQPAFDAAGQDAGWRIVSLTKRSCPSVDVVTPLYRRVFGARDCAVWRARAVAWLRAHPPTLVVLTNTSHYGIRERAWARGLRETIDALRGRMVVAVLADTPSHRQVPHLCLRAHPDDMSRCVTPRSAAFVRHHQRLERQVAVSSGSLHIDLGDKVCPYDPCPVVMGRTMMWRDQHHMTRSFSRQLAPSVRSELEAAVEP